MVFPKWTNKLPLILVAGAAVTVCFVGFVFWYWFSPKHLVVGYQPEQPIAFDHQLHAGQLEMDTAIIWLKSALMLGSLQQKRA